MSQLRFIEYGTPITAESIRKLNYGLHHGGVYSGLDIATVDTYSVGIWPGFFLFPAEDGTLVELNSQDPTIPAFQLSINPANPKFSQLALDPATESADYWVVTIYALHNVVELLGGEPVYIDAMLNPSNPTVPMVDIAGGIILGWIYHPGLGAALEDKMIQPVPKMQTPDLLSVVNATRPVVLTADDLFNKSIKQQAIPTTYHMELLYSPADRSYVEVLNPAGAPDDLDAIFQFKTTGFIPRRFTFEAQLPSLTWISFEAFDGSGNPFLVDPVTIVGPAGPVSWATYQTNADLPYTAINDFEKGKYWHLRIRFTSPVIADMIKIRNFVISYWPFPFEDIY